MARAASFCPLAGRHGRHRVGLEEAVTTSRQAPQLHHSTLQESLPCTSVHALHRQHKARPAGARADLTCLRALRRSMELSQGQLVTTDRQIPADRRVAGELLTCPQFCTCRSFMLSSSSQISSPVAGRCEAPFGADVFLRGGARKKVALFVDKSLKDAPGPAELATLGLGPLH